MTRATKTHECHGSIIEPFPEGPYRWRVSDKQSPYPRSKPVFHGADSLPEARDIVLRGPRAPLASLVDNLVADGIIFETASSRSVRIVGYTDAVEGIGGRRVEIERALGERAFDVRVLRPYRVGELHPHARYEFPDKFFGKFWDRGRATLDEVMSRVRSKVSAARSAEEEEGEEDEQGWD